MSRFIKTTSGYLNQDHILLIRFGMTKEEEGQDLIQMSDGRSIQTQIMDFDWLGPTYAADEYNRRMAMGAATEPEGPKYPAPGWAAAQNRRMAMGAAAEAAEAPGQKETPAGGTGGSEGSDAVPETPPRD